MDNFDLKKFLVENKLTTNSKLLKEVDTSNWGNEEDDSGTSEKDYRPKPSLADFDYDEEAYKKYMKDNFPGEPLEEGMQYKHNEGEPNEQIIYYNSEDLPQADLENYSTDDFEGYEFKASNTYLINGYNYQAIKHKDGLQLIPA